ncbi:MAG: histidinol dehydrogenase [Nitrospinota bacterium]|nr:histidinol dehydrogenase [Nitrospinota bacterium]
MKILVAGSLAFDKALTALDGRMGESSSGATAQVVSKIIADVRKRGDKALFAYTRKFDKITPSAKNIRLSDSEIGDMERHCHPKVVHALKTSAARIRRFHMRQVERSWSLNEPGATLGQIIRPIEAVGIYVPGGKASYPSSALMNAIPARIAGVKRIVMVSPAPGGLLNPHTIAAARIAGVDEIFRVGGAQAIAALAYGTSSITPVDKIVGPGNAYVAEAKRQVFGKVAIDMVAGPSEILIIADDAARPDVVAADLLSQAEHDEKAYPILVTTSAALASSVAGELKRQTKKLDRKDIVEACLKRNCFAFVVENIDGAVQIANRFGPEHLEILIKKPGAIVKKIENAGAIFVGPWTPEALGDYSAGPNHVLPTGGTARFYSPLGVYDFIKRTSYLNFTKAGFQKLAGGVMAVAREEGLDAHARAVEIRLKK